MRRRPTTLRPRVTGRARRSAAILVAGVLLAAGAITAPAAHGETGPGEEGPAPCDAPTTGETRSPEPAAAEPSAVSEASSIEASSIDTVGRITADITNGLHPWPDEPSVITRSPGAESTLANFIADVQLWNVQRGRAETAIALVDSRAIGADLTYESSGADDPDGNLTFSEVHAVHPSVLLLCTLRLTGNELRTALEQQWRPSNAREPFVKLGVSRAVTYVADYTAPVGSRITHLWFDGRPVGADESFTVAVEVGLATPGSGFDVLAAATDRAETGRTNLLALVQWFETFGTASPDYAQRSIGVTVVPRGPGGLAPAAPIRVDLASLDFTTTEPRAREATITFVSGGGSQWSNPVDSSLVAHTDEAGRASVFPTIPADAHGAIGMTIATATGTRFTVPIDVSGDVFEPVATTTVGWPNTPVARSGVYVRFTVQVRAEDGSPPIGEVTLYEGSKALRTGALTESQNGRITLIIPALPRGLHLLTAKYHGSQLQQPSVAPRVPFVVF